MRVSTRVCTFYDARTVFWGTKYKLDAESRKLRALESRGGPGLSAFERSEDATKGPQGANLFRAMATRARNSNSVHLKWRTSAAFSLESRARGLGRTSTTGSPLPVAFADRWGDSAQRK